jgi:hypothetical protein
MKARHVYLLYEVEKGPKGVDLQKIKKSKSTAYQK